MLHRVLLSVTYFALIHIICSQIVALFVVAKNGKQSKCPSVG